MSEQNEVERAKKLALTLRIKIPNNIAMNFWMLPILETLLDRIENLERNNES